MHVVESDVVDLLNKYEARGMRTQQDVVWHKAFGHTIVDINGKEYIDFSSGVMITNAGHDCQPIKQAIAESLDQGILTSYMFPNLAKAKLFQVLADCIPENYKVALFSTGAETTEAAIKIARIWGEKTKKNSKNLIVSFKNAFHGRTLGALCVAGIEVLKSWIPKETQNLSVQVPYPEPLYSKNLTFQNFLDSLAQQKISTADISSVIIECYQGAIGYMAPKDYMQQLAEWCKQNNILLIVDEIQSGFCRTGKFWAYQHYNFIPDIILAGKGMSSSLPLSAAIARDDVIDVCDPGTLNTTHSGNIICCAAAAANIKFLKDNKIAERVEKLGNIFSEYLMRIQEKFPQQIRVIFSIGLMAALQIGNRKTNAANPILAKKLVKECVQRGLMMYAGGGPEGATIKLAPPLIISEEALIRGCSIMEEVLENNL